MFPKLVVLSGGLMDTVFPKVDPSKRNWYLVDAEGKTLGRLAVTVTRLLSGKDKPTWSPHYDCGDNVIVVNAEKIVVTGHKDTDKVYRHYTGYNGGLRAETYEKLLARIPERVIEKAIKGMLPHTKLGRELFRKLHVYKGTAHPHAAQKPTKLEA